jgi:ribosomal-protein-alanine N-acetyltransferase
MWSLDGYRRELASPNSDLLVLQKAEGEGEGEGEGRWEDEKDEEGENRGVHSHPSHPSLFSPLLGFACLWSIADEAHITILAVHPDYRQRGLGQALLVALLRSAQQRGLKWATLEVRASNQAAITLYQRFGFQEAGRRKRYYQDNGEDALILWRGGLQDPAFLQTLNLWQQYVHDRLQQWGWTLDWSTVWKD